MIERRKRRSNHPAEALELFMQALTARLGAESVVLADDAGRLVSRGGRDRETALLAALGPLEGPAQRLLKNLSGQPDSIRLAEAEVDGRTFHLASRGGAPLPHQEVQSTLQRIFAAA